MTEPEIPPAISGVTYKRLTVPPMSDCSPRLGFSPSRELDEAGRATLRADEIGYSSLGTRESEQRLYCLAVPSWYGV
jgi:hypothetical protein